MAIALTSNPQVVILDEPTTGSQCSVGLMDVVAIFVGVFC